MLQHLTKRQKVIIMVAVMSGLFLAALDQTIVGTALPKILTEFNALKELTWVITAYLLTSTVTVPIAGKLSDLYGRRKLLLVGITIFVLSSLLCGAAQDIGQLIAYRALQGIGGGILFSNAFATIGDLFDARERGKWSGIFGAVFGLSSLIGPLLGGWLTDGATILSLTTNWRWTFLINVPVGIIAFGLIARYLPTVVTDKEKGIDYLGAALLTIALSTLVLATSLGGSSVSVPWSSEALSLAWNSVTIIGAYIVCALSTAAFIFVESRAKDPILPLRMFKNSIFNVICILFLLFGAAFMGAMIYIPTFAQQVLNFSATNSGIIMLPMVITLTVASVLTGQVVNKTGKYKWLTVAGLIIATGGLVSLGGLSISSDYWDLAWRMGITGFGLGIAMPVFTLAVQNALPQSELGVATSSTQLFRSIGGTVGMAVMGSVLNNQLTSNLGNLSNEKFIQIANASGQGDTFSNLDINTVQGVLSQQGQSAITSQLQHLPAQAQQPAIDAFHHFVTTLQSALASSITHVFLVSAGIMVIAVVISFGLKEIPLKHHEGVIPTE